MRTRLVGLSLVLLLAVPFALAQQGTSSLKGRVTAGDGSILPGVTVTIKNQDTGSVRTTTTDKDAVYVMNAVIPGTYDVVAELSGFKTFKRRNVRLEVGKTSTIDVKLDMGAAAEEITVTAAAPMVDVTSKEVGGNISAKELTELPSVNRNFIGFVALLPGVVPNISTESFGSDSVSVNGQDPRNNNYMFDGGNNNDDVIGQRAGTQARTPLDAVQEFQVITGQYDAEFGRTTGAVINAVTKAGTNEFKGVLSGYLQQASLTEKDFIRKQQGADKPDTKSVQYVGNLGGPIIQDRLHFFTNVERVENDRPNPITIAARPEIVEPVTQDRVWNTLVRVDNQLNPSNTWFARWLRESSPQLNQIIGNVTPAASREESDIDQTAVAQYDAVLGPTKLNTARVVWTQENVAFGNPGFNGNGRNQALLAPTLAFLTYSDQQSDVAQARVDDAYQFNDTFNWYAKKHDMKFGVEYERAKEHAITQDNMNGTFTFLKDTFNPADPSTYPVRFSIRVPNQSDLRLKATYMSAFMQDKWAISDNATVNLGLRYDLERLPFTEADSPTFAGGQGYPKDNNNFSPRLGVTYQIPGAKTTVFRAGVGRFYDKTHLELIQGVETAGMFSSSFVAQFPTSARDPGPSAGKLPTDPFLINGPVVNHAAIAALFPPGTKIKNTGTINLDNPDRTVPYTDMISFGGQRQLTSNMTVNLDFVHASAKDILMNVDLNPGTRATTSPAATLTRSNTAVFGTSSAIERVNAGHSTYNALEFQLDHHLGAAYQYRVSYTYSRSRGNTSGNGVQTSPFQFLTDVNLSQNEGPTDFDKPHNLVLSGSWRVPRTHGMILGMVTRYLSGDPFTIQDQNFDLNRNGVLLDPLPTGQYSPNEAPRVSTIGTPANPYPVFNRGGRNGARGPDFFQTDMRVGYDIPVHGTTLQVFGEIFNVTNRANFANPSGDRRLNAAGQITSSTYLNLTALRSGAVPRTAQVAVKLLY
jgi:outer membrane receptor for ferrienterochelin and colicin